MTRMFGTDGVRGRANTYPMTAEVAMKLAMAAGRYFTRGSHRVVIGKDTRLSGYMLENALTAGLTSSGMNVAAELVRPVSHPSVTVPMPIQAPSTSTVVSGLGPTPRNRMVTVSLMMSTAPVTPAAPPCWLSRTWSM